ncbi:GNAT family N-acetyltransferase [Paenibacillus sp. PR3]|uniref:GNAT family N-acetyltransferase n=1 Tax=Paenibacillus terricola TaxID=2763503 RepID=A0ABR8MTW8_9BACL|nr:GNAT family N-acetyltransferase [Paenibacillus terricola]MBD3918427.1 GNAT family N-acetyltransferase [Paenibacillus terricola]
MNYPIIETERLYMRELTLEDIEAVYKHFSIPEVVRFMDIEVCKDLQEAEEIIAFHINDTGCRYGLFDKETNKFIGTCGFHCWSTDQDETKAEIGFDLAPPYWGRGIMQEALHEMIRLGFDLMKLDYIEATTEIENVQSQKLLKKLAFNQDKDLKDGLFYFTLRGST